MAALFEMKQVTALLRQDGYKRSGAQLREPGFEIIALFLQLSAHFGFPQGGILRKTSILAAPRS